MAKAKKQTESTQVFETGALIMAVVIMSLGIVSLRRQISLGAISGMSNSLLSIYIIAVIVATICTTLAYQKNGRKHTRNLTIANTIIVVSSVFYGATLLFQSS